MSPMAPAGSDRRVDGISSTVRGGRQMKYRPPLGLSRPLDRDCAVVIAADRDARSPRDVLLAVVPFDEALPGQRHPRASRRHRHLRGGAGYSVRFHADMQF